MDERHKILGLDPEGFFRIIRDIERADPNEDLQTGTVLKLLDVVLVGHTYFAKVRPKHHEDDDSFMVALDKLF